MLTSFVCRLVQKVSISKNATFYLRYDIRYNSYDKIRKIKKNMYLISNDFLQSVSSLC